MPGDQVEVSIDQERHIEAEGLDALGNLPDLLLAVQPRVCRIRVKLFDRSVNDFKRLAAGYWRTGRSQAIHCSGALRTCMEIITDRRRQWILSQCAGGEPTMALVITLPVNQRRVA